MWYTLRWNTLWERGQLCVACGIMVYLPLGVVGEVVGVQRDFFWLLKASWRGKWSGKLQGLGNSEKTHQWPPFKARMLNGGWTSLCKLLTVVLSGMPGGGCVV